MKHISKLLVLLRSKTKDSVTREIEQKLRVCGNILNGDFGYGLSIKKSAPYDGDSRECPWFTYSSLEYLNQLNLSDAKVFEWGSGHSTLYWGRIAASVLSIEFDSVWYQKLLPRLTANTKTLLKPTRQSYVDALSESGTTYDIIVIDGDCRYDCAAVAPDFLNEGGIIILDNSDWHPNSAEVLREKGFVQIDFISFGPINVYQWSTSLFFRSNPKFSRISNNLNIRAGITTENADDHCLLSTT